MPIRPRKHKLEEESRTALRVAFPERLLIRDQTPDYGLDFIVEVFKDSGGSTGKTFGVQLKATDDSKLKSALKHSFKLDHLNYYRSLSQPVMLVKYLASSNSLHWKWAHSKIGAAKNSQKTITVNFGESHKIDDLGISRICNELRQWYRFNQGPPRFPIELRAFDESGTIDIADLVLACMKVKTKSQRSMLKIQLAEHDTSIGSISFGEGRILVSLGGDTTTCSIPYDSVEDINTDFILRKIMYGLGTILGMGGLSRLASEIFTYLLERNYQPIDEPHTLSAMVMSFFDCDELDKVLRVCDDLLARDKVNEYQLIMMPLYTATNKSSSAHEKLMSHLHNKYLEYLQMKDAPDEYIGTAQYNRANCLRSFGDEQGAARAYLIARRKEPNYLGQEYYWMELGACAFNLGRYELASLSYNNVLKCDSSHKEVRVYYADALMMSGRYAEALDQFRTHIDSDLNCDSIWVLKRFCLEELLADGAPTIQKRRPLELKTHFGVIQSLGADEVEELLNNYDLMSSRTWFELGLVHSEAKKYSEASFAFTCASVLDIGQLDAWLNAFSLSARMKDANLCGHILGAAIDGFGSEFISALYEFMERTFGDEETKYGKELLLRFHEERKASLGKRTVTWRFDPFNRFRAKFETVAHKKET